MNAPVLETSVGVALGLMKAPDRSGRFFQGTTQAGLHASQGRPHLGRRHSQRLGHDAVKAPGQFGHSGIAVLYLRQDLYGTMAVIEMGLIVRTIRRGPYAAHEDPMPELPTGILSAAPTASAAD